jgi:transposase InsO family protein
LLALIRSIQAELKGPFGSPRMARELRARGICASNSRVERLMREHGIRGATSAAARPLARCIRPQQIACLTNVADDLRMLEHAAKTYPGLIQLFLDYIPK